MLTCVISETAAEIQPIEMQHESVTHKIGNYLP